MAVSIILSGIFGCVVENEDEGSSVIAVGVRSKKSYPVTKRLLTMPIAIRAIPLDQDTSKQ